MDSLPPWPVVQSMLLSVVLPGFGVAAVLLAAVCAATSSAQARLIGGAVALMGGLAAGNFASSLLPWWSLETGWPSLFPATFLAVAGGVVATVASAKCGASWGMALRFLTLAGCAWWLTPAGLVWTRLGMFLLLFGGSALNGEALRRIGTQNLGPTALLALAIPWGGAAATILIHAHSARFCDLAVLQTAALAGVGLVVVLRKLELATLFAGPAVFFPGLMLGGAANTYSEVPLASFILVALAPCALWSLRLPWMRHWSGRACVVATVIAILIPCAVAVALAMRAESLDFGG